MKSLLMGPSGGTAAGMGAFEKFFCYYACNHVIWLVPGMWRTMCGLTNNQPLKANPYIVEDWDKIGGSPFVPSCKDTNVFKVKIDGKEVDLSGKVQTFCEGNDGIIAVGGDGTTFQSQELYEAYGINSIVVLATMDNNIPCFDNTIGFETAVFHSSNSIQAGVNDAITMQRPTIIFGMGYSTGRLLVNSVKRARRLTNGYGEINLIQIPETMSSPEDVANFIKATYKGYGPYVAVIAEGCAEKIVGTDDGKHKVYDTNGYANKIQDLTGIEFKVLHTDYMQRSSAPCRADIRLAKRFALKACSLVNKDQWNYVIGSFNNRTIIKPIDEVAYIVKNTKPSLEEWYNTDFLSIDELSRILVK